MKYVLLTSATATEAHVWLGYDAACGIVGAGEHRVRFTDDTEGRRVCAKCATVLRVALNEGCAPRPLKRPKPMVPVTLTGETVRIWADGACEPNPGIGGWGWLRSDGQQAYGGARGVTNNQMELTAILRALEALPDGTDVVVYSDSQYAVKGLTIWSTGWARKKWMKNDAPMPNRDLWLALEAQKQRLRAQFQWVRGHNGDVGNEAADALATKGRLTA